MIWVGWNGLVKRGFGEFTEVGLSVIILVVMLWVGCLDGRVDAVAKRKGIIRNKGSHKGNRGIPTGADGRALTQNERSFIANYLRHFDYVKAYEEAGYKKQTPFGTISAAREVLSRPTVMAAIADFLSINIMSREEVLTRLTEQARNTHAQYFTEDGSVDLVTLIQDGKAHLIKSVKPTRYGVEVEFMDGQKALEMMGRHHKLFTDRIESTEDVVLRVEYAEDIDPQGG